nr:MAG TPA: hypothetical protein [Caudoviricetes sp.]
MLVDNSLRVSNIEPTGVKREEFQCRFLMR